MAADRAGSFDKGPAALCKRRAAVVRIA